jgi:hypothetical protein
MTNTSTNRMKRLIADISEHGATPSRVKKITNALRAVTAERDAAADRVKELRDGVVRLSDWQPISTAPKDGTPVLVKIKDDLSPWGIKPGSFGGTDLFAGLYAVMRNRGDIMDWCFAAPVGRGGFSDEWLDCWMSVPAKPTTQEGVE